MIPAENFHQFLIGRLHIYKAHVDPGNHDISGNRISQIEHIVDHLFFFWFDHTLFVTYLYDRSQLIFRNTVCRLVGIHAQKTQNPAGEQVYNKNNRCQYGHEKADYSRKAKGVFFCLQSSYGFWRNLSKKQH